MCLKGSLNKMSTVPLNIIKMPITQKYLYIYISLVVGSKCIREKDADLPTLMTEKEWKTGAELYKRISTTISCLYRWMDRSSCSATHGLFKS